MGKIQAVSQLQRPSFYPILDPSTSTYDTINRMIRSFVNTGSTLTLGKGNWIHQYILHAPESKRGLNLIDAGSFIRSLKISWIKRYSTEKLDDH